MMQRFAIPLIPSILVECGQFGLAPSQIYHSKMTDSVNEFGDTRAEKTGGLQEGVIPHS